MADDKQRKKEREKARALRKTRWWKQKLADGRCHYCGADFSADALTMDHIVPVSRGGRSVKGNVVPSCKPCNTKKQAQTPVDLLLAQLSHENPSSE